MKKLVVLLFCLCALPLSASPDADLESILGGTLAVDAPTAAANLSSDRILAAIRGAEQPGEHTVRVTYQVEGRAVHVETIRFTVGGGESEIRLPLLPWSAERRRAFVGGFGERSLVLDHPDGSRQSVPLDQLLFDTGRWIAQGLPEASPSQVTSPPSPLRTPRPDHGSDVLFVAATSCTESCCNNGCDSQLNDCETYCGPGAAESCLLWCEAQWHDCLDDCEGCPHVTEWTETVFDSETFLGGELCLDDHLKPWEGTKRYFRHERKFKNTTYRQTRACDGTVTTVVLGVNFTTQICWKRTAVGCSFKDLATVCRY